MAAKSKRQPKADKPQVTLNEACNIPLDKLVISDDNVRKVRPDATVTAFAEGIARRSLLQSLSVRPVLGEDGEPTGFYAVQGGGRRLRALQLLARQKRLAKDAPVPCIIKTTGIVEDDSLAENTDREELHPLDQFRAFAALRAKGQSEEDIAAAFAVTPPVVRQRLRLASASPKLLDAYASDALNLDQLMAFCVTEDHARQEQVLEAVTRREVTPNSWNIRRLLTETCVEADDPRARYVGLDAYSAAGGTIMRDLFEDDDGGWLQDPELLMRLVSEKLGAERERILAQGWKWVEAALETPFNLKFSLGRLPPVAQALTDGEREHYEALSQEHDTLIEGLDDEESIPADVRARLDAIEAELAALDNRPPKFAAEDVARAGVLVSVNHNGQLNVEYGFLRPEDQAAADENSDVPADGDGADDDFDDEAESPSAASDDAGQDDGAKPLPDRLVQDLTACRTVALRDAMGRDFDTAFLAVLHAMCLELFYRYAPHSCLQIKANDHFPAGATGLADMAAAKALEERHEQCAARLPQDPRDLWEALTVLDADSRAALFAHCASLTVNAVREAHQPRREALRHADRLAAALSLDMPAAGWVTTAETYLSRVTKAQIMEAVREAKGESTAQLIAHLKKADMAREAERLLEGTAWLPEALRAPRETTSVPAHGQPASAPALPDFLTEDVDRDEDVERLAAE